MSGPTSWDGLPGDGPWEREVPVLVRSGEQGRDDKVQPLQLRLALQPGKQLHSGRVRPSVWLAVAVGAQRTPVPACGAETGVGV